MSPCRAGIVSIYTQSPPQLELVIYLEKFSTRSENSRFLRRLLIQYHLHALELEVELAVLSFVPMIWHLDNWMIVQLTNGTQVKHSSLFAHMEWKEIFVYE
jgi:hypothetical protein